MDARGSLRITPSTPRVAPADRAARRRTTRPREGGRPRPSRPLFRLYPAGGGDEARCRVSSRPSVRVGPSPATEPPARATPRRTTADPDRLPTPVDRNPYKHGRFLPGTTSRSSIRKRSRRRDPPPVDPPWNLKDEIIGQMARSAPGGQFVIPIPRSRSVTSPRPLPGGPEPIPRDERGFFARSWCERVRHAVSTRAWSSATCPSTSAGARSGDALPGGASSGKLIRCTRGRSTM